MTNPFNTRASKVGTPCGHRFNGETILHYPSGKESAASEVTAIVTWNPTQVDNSRGRGTKRGGELLLNDSVTVTVKDAFSINDVRAEVVSIDPIQDGSQTVYISQHIPETKGASPIRTGEI